MTRVVGLDLSLTQTGMAFAASDESGVKLSTKTHKSKTTGMGLSDRAGRLWSLTSRVLKDTCEFRPDLVLLESPALHQTSGSHHDRSGYWWLVVKELLDSGLVVAEVSIGTLKKYATGSGSAGKDQIVIAVTRRYPAVQFETNDEADALVLAAIGCRMLGSPVELTLPKLNLDASKGFPKLEVPVA